MKPRSISESAPTETRLRTPELEEQIRARAYEIYEQHGRNEGHAIDDWLQAEAELTGESETAAA
jgi:hypothetical protein